MLVLGCGKLSDLPAAEHTDPSGVAASSPDGGATAPVATAVPTRQGIVQLNTGTSPAGVDVWANFPIAPEATFDSIEFGSQCRLYENVPPPSEPRPSDSAGDVVVDLPSLGNERAVTIPFREATHYYTLPDPRPTWQLPGGVPIRVRAPGGTIPAFEGSILSAYPAQLLEPLSGAVLHRDATDLAVRWQSANTRTVVGLHIGAAQAFCEFSPGATSGVIPGALLRRVVANANTSACQGAACASLTIAWTSEAAQAHVIVGDLDVTIGHWLNDRRSLTLD